MDRLEKLGRLQMRLQDGEVFLVSKDLAKRIGLFESITYSELINRSEKFHLANKLTEDGFFPWTIRACQKEFGLGRYMQVTIFGNLQALGLIEIKNITDEFSHTRRSIRIVEDESILKRILEQEE